VGFSTMIGVTGLLRPFRRFRQLRERHVLNHFDRLLVRMSQLNAAHSEAEVEADLRAARADLQARRWSALS